MAADTAGAAVAEAAAGSRSELIGKAPPGAPSFFIGWRRDTTRFKRNGGGPLEGRPGGSSSGSPAVGGPL